MPDSSSISADEPALSSDEARPAADLTPSIVIKLRNGDADAGRLLDQLHRAPMLRFCAGYLRNPVDAEDAVQEIFCAAIKSTLVPDNFRPWLYKIARNHCLQVLRSRQRRPDPAGLPSASIAAEHITAYLSRLIKVESVGRVEDLLAQLSAQQVELLRLRYSENLSRKEIAEIMEEPEAIIKSRLFEAIDKLRRLAAN
jgi:RNA polymerase sigma-70 factor (ECF subfamily)